MKDRKVSWPKTLKLRRTSTKILRGMIHFSDRERMDVWDEPVWAAHSRASMADAPPPMMATFLPLAVCLGCGVSLRWESG